jgi:hypothetical protein
MQNLRPCHMRARDRRLLGLGDPIEDGDCRVDLQ